MLRLFIFVEICFLILVVNFPVFGQLRLGIRGGGAISSVIYSSRIQTDEAAATHTDVQRPALTYYGGLFLQHNVGKRLALRTEIQYFKKSWEIQANDRGRISNFRQLREYNINYVEVPVNLFLTAPLSNGKIYIGAGPYVSMALNGWVKADEKIADIEFNQVDEPVFTFLPGDGYKPIQFVNHFTINKIDYGVNGKFGYQFLFGLLLEAGVDLGLREVSTSHERFEMQWNRSVRDPNTSVKYSIFYIGAGWTINNK